MPPAYFLHLPLRSLLLALLLLDPRSCRFGHWLENPGRERYGNFPGFAQLVHAHEAVHAAGHRIDQLAREDRIAARGLLTTLHARHDDLLHSLASLRGEVCASRGESTALHWARSLRCHAYSPRQAQTPSGDFCRTEKTRRGAPIFWFTEMALNLASAGNRTKIGN